jgi:hypothetical protein
VSAHGCGRSPVTRVSSRAALGPRCASGGRP